MASDPPKVLISYSHDSPEHAEHVLELANRLRADGIDCVIDQYVVVPAAGWTLWMEKQIEASDFVLMVCTETYFRRVRDDEESGKGLGVRWEGGLIYRALYRDGRSNTKFIPVLFETGDSVHIPGPVGDTNSYLVQTERGYEDLYRRLTNQPLTIKPELGKLRSLPRAERKSEGGADRSKSSVTETKIPLLQYEQPLIEAPGLPTRKQQPMPSDSKARVFVSHSNKDKPFVRKLAEALEKHLLNVWVAEHQIKVGDSLVGKISEALKDADYLVIVLSQASISSRWVEQELNVALTNQISGKVVVLPVLLEDCELPILLRDRLYADFRVDFNVGIQALVAAFEREGESTVDFPAALGPAPAPAASVTPASLREKLLELLSDRMIRAEVGRLWYAVLQTPMDDEMGQRSKSDCVIGLLAQATNRNQLPRLTEELRKIRPDLVGLSADSPNSAVTLPGSSPQSVSETVSSEATSLKAAKPNPIDKLLRRDNKWWFLGFAADGVAIAAMMVGWDNVRQRLPNSLPEFLKDWWLTIALTPFGVLFCFQAVLWLRWWTKERRLARMAEQSIGYRENQQKRKEKAEYFSISPLTRRDANRFTRTDNAHELFLEWLLRTREKIVYLTSTSGSGKSSLLQAFVLPKLEASTQSFRCLLLRSFGDLAHKLREELLAMSVIWDDTADTDDTAPMIDDSLRSLVDKACQHLKAHRLLLVFDQFEAFLAIYDRDQDRGHEFIELLSSVQSNPIKNLTILLVLRSDALDLLQALNKSSLLPFIDYESNAMFISAFREGHARAFLERSPLDIKEPLMNDIFEQMQEIESEGSFRPIILNMMGLFLERKAINDKRPIESLRENFIEEHLSKCINRGDVRVYGARVLNNMITRRAMARQKSVLQLSRETGISEKAIAGCMVNLSEQGIVRCTDKREQIWEISHDVVAQLLNNIIHSRWRIPTPLFCAVPSVILLLVVCYFAIAPGAHWGAYTHTMLTDSRAITPAFTPTPTPALTPTPGDEIIRDPQVRRILDIAGNSPIAREHWANRGVAPIGYIKGMAAAYALVYCNWRLHDPGSLEMARAANTDELNTDALAWLNKEFIAAGMRNDVSGSDTLRHLFVLLTGLGMWESSGNFSSGRDPTNPFSNTAANADAGLFQSSYAAASAIPLYSSLVNKYANSSALRDIFQEGVSVSLNDLWDIGSGPGLEFQVLSVRCPAFAVEFAALGVRRIRNHWGPIARREIWIFPHCDEMFRQVEKLIDDSPNSIPEIRQSLMVGAKLLPKMGTGR